jgi:hypothetical protein
MATSKKRSSRKGEGKPPCPACASPDVVPVVWGLPADETFKRAGAGKVARRGCVISDDDPAWHCKACGKDFGRATRPGLLGR